jgi:hypothetical protein
VVPRFLVLFGEPFRIEFLRIGVVLFVVVYPQDWYQDTGTFLDDEVRTGNLIILHALSREQRQRRVLPQGLVDHLVHILHLLDRLVGDFSSIFGQNCVDFVPNLVL